jgi:hypothetical protein
MPNNLAQVENLICPSPYRDLNIEFRTRLVRPATHGSHGWEGRRARGAAASEEDAYRLVSARDVKVDEHGDGSALIMYRGESKALQIGYLARKVAILLRLVI